MKKLLPYVAFAITASIIVVLLGALTGLPNGAALGVIIGIVTVFLSIGFAAIGMEKLAKHLEIEFYWLFLIIIGTTASVWVILHYGQELIRSIVWWGA